MSSNFARFPASGVQTDYDPTPLQPAGGMQFSSDDQVFSPEQLARRKLISLSIAIPIALILAVAGIYLLVLQVWSMTSRGEVEKNNFAGAISGYSAQLTLSSLTPLEWVANYNLGTAYLLDSQIDLAIEYLESALVEVPKAQRDEQNLIQYFSYECAVRENLSTAYSVNGQTDLAQETLSVCLLFESQDDSSGSGSSSGSNSGSESDSSEQNSESNSGESGDEQENEEQTSSDNQEDDSDSSQNQDDDYGDETEEERERREQLENKNQQHSEEQQADEEEENSGSSRRVRGW